VKWPSSRRKSAPVAPATERNGLASTCAGSEHSATQGALVEALGRISDLHANLAAELAALAQNLEAAVAVGPEQSVHADMPETAALDDLLTTRELCSMLHLHARTERRMELLGELPAPIRTGRRKTWRREAIEAWLADHEGNAW
jgi:predicted DNA-binding transcriptional regulator AlpA